MADAIPAGGVARCANELVSWLTYDPCNRLDTGWSRVLKGVARVVSRGLLMDEKWF